MNLIHFFAAAAASLLPLQTLAADCGGDTECRIKNGSYRIELLPEGRSKGVVVFFHGYKSSAEAQMKHRALVEVAHAHGLAFAAADGLNGTWSHGGAPSQDRDETAFVGTVFDDLETRFGFTSSNIVVSGFSQGASMAWYTLCNQGKRFAGAVTFSGVFWNPLPAPEDCAAGIPPAVHFHGRADRTFPLSGRPIGTRFHQGDTFLSRDVIRESAGCTMPSAVKKTIGGIECDIDRGCGRGDLALCIHDGGHRADPALLDAGLTQIGF